MMIKKNQKGFTLIELLIVIAIIAILAAIAIPQFAAYRIRGYNASGESDLRNTRTAEEALFADYRVYGRSDNNALPCGGGAGGGAALAGPFSASTNALAGACLTATPVIGGVATIVGAGFVVGAGNEVQADTDNPGMATYTLVAKPVPGNRAFAAELESSGILYQQNDAWIGVNIGGTGVGWATTTAPDIGPATPIAAWLPL